MDLDGPAAIYRWSGVLKEPAAKDTLTGRDSGCLKKELELPCGEGGDHPEGMALLPCKPGERQQIVVVYDSPAKSRLLGKTDVLADVFELPHRRG